MSGLKVNFDGMSANGQKTVQLADDFFKRLDSLQKAIDDLNKIWRGESATAFSRAYAEQHANFNKFATLLEELGENISRAARSYQATEEENTADAGNLF